jgi:hypothetical protein
MGGPPSFLSLLAFSHLIKLMYTKVKIMPAMERPTSTLAPRV